MNKYILFLLISFCLLFSHFIYGENTPVYTNDFSEKKDFSHSEPCYFYQNEFHLFSHKSSYFCWENSFHLPEKNRIQAKIITQNVSSLQSSNNAGILFRLKDINNTLLFYIYPATQNFGIGYWEVTPKNPKGSWKTIIKARHDSILVHENILDIINLKEKIYLYINGEKVYETAYPATKKISFNGYVGFYTSTYSHFHFDDLKIWENPGQALPEVRKPENKPHPYPNDKPDTSQAYKNLGSLLVQYNFNGPLDSPFNEKLNNHTEQGKYLIWNESGLRPMGGPLSNEDYLVETALRIGNTRQSGWAGVAARSDNDLYYALLINPLLKKAKLERKQNGVTSLIFEMDAPSIKSGEFEINKVALQVDKQKITSYINDEKINESIDNSDINGNYYGIMSDSNEPVFFDYIRVYALKRSFFQKVLSQRWLYIVLLAFLFFMWRRKKKVREKIAFTEKFKEKIIKELLKEMPGKKSKRIHDKDLIFRYQITKKQAEDILSTLATQYGGYFDSDDEGNLYVTFE